MSSKLEYVSYAHLGQVAVMDLRDYIVGVVLRRR